jgi:hypothetical protein
MTPLIFLPYRTHFIYVVAETPSILTADSETFERQYPDTVDARKLLLLLLVVVDVLARLVRL